MSTKLYLTDPDPGTVEGALIKAARLSVGDYGRVSPILPTDIMWAVLLEAAKNVANDVPNYAFAEPLADKDFVISPVPSAAIRRLIKLSMVAVLRDSAYAKQSADGVGAKIKAGLDSIDTGKSVDMGRDLHEKADKAYRHALFMYNARLLQPIDIDLYKDTGADDTLEIN